MDNQIRSRLRRVSSRQNPLVKDLRWCFTHGELTPQREFAIEGVRAIEEAIRSGLRFRAVFFSEPAIQVAERLLGQLSSHVEVVLLPDETFRSAVDTATPQGVAALVQAKSYKVEELFSSSPPLLVVAAGIQDPGNLGTMIRSAEAFGASGVLLVENTVSQWNSKVIRAAAGSLLRLPVVATRSFEVLDLLRKHRVRALAASSHKGSPIPDIDLRNSAAIFIGNEGAGLAKDLLSKMDETIFIPQSAKVDSLNAGVAASIILYEAARQRRSRQPR